MYPPLGIIVLGLPCTLEEVDKLCGLLADPGSGLLDRPERACGLKLAALSENPYQQRFQVNASRSYEDLVTHLTKVLDWDGARDRVYLSFVSSDLAIPQIPPKADAVPDVGNELGIYFSGKVDYARITDAWSLFSYNHMERNSLHEFYLDIVDLCPNVKTLQLDIPDHEATMCWWPTQDALTSNVDDLNNLLTLVHAQLKRFAQLDLFKITWGPYVSHILLAYIRQSFDDEWGKEETKLVDYIKRQVWYSAQNKSIQDLEI